MGLEDAGASAGNDRARSPAALRTLGASAGTRTARTRAPCAAISADGAGIFFATTTACSSLRLPVGTPVDVDQWLNYCCSTNSNSPTPCCLLRPLLVRPDAPYPQVAPFRLSTPRSSKSAINNLPAI